MRRRYPNPTLAKRLRCYTVEGVARLYGCHKNTVRNWVRQGLPPIDDRRPMLINGAVLNAFQADRRAKVKRPCGPGEIYCLPCRKPQRPAGDMADHIALSATTGKLRAICPDCERTIVQRVNAKRLAVFRALIDVSEAKA